MYKSKFDFYDIVKVSTKKTNLLKINGCLGVVRGKSQSEENPEIFAYAIDILNENGTVADGWFIFEEDLQPTGKKANSNEFETGEKIKVQVDLKTGKGGISSGSKE